MRQQRVSTQGHCERVAFFSCVLADSAGERIPLAARILCVADVYDALTTTRSYRPGMTHARAAEIMRGSTGQFDPHLLEIFLEWAETADIPGRPTPQRMAIFASVVDS